VRKVNRIFNSLSHFQFKMKLKYQCLKWQRKLHIVNESYTSKTCGRCGNINNELGSSKSYKCSKCHLEIDRDINGARNIYLKNIGLDESL
jgi:putative transposase